MLQFFSLIRCDLRFFSLSLGALLFLTILSYLWDLLARSFLKSENYAVLGRRE